MIKKDNVLKENFFTLPNGNIIQLIIKRSCGNIKKTFQLKDKNDKDLSPVVDYIIYDEEKNTLLFEDSIELDDGNLVTFRFMTDERGIQIGMIGNDFEDFYDAGTLLIGDFKQDKYRYLSYKKRLKNRIQEKIDKNLLHYIEEQSTFINHHFSKKREDNTL